MSDTLKEKNEAKWKRAWKKINQDFRSGKINEEEMDKLWTDLNKKFPGVAAKNRTLWRETKMFKIEFEKKKERIRKKEIKNYD